MMKFFTNICRRGDKFLVREVVDGERKKYVQSGFSPDIFVPSNDPSIRAATGMDGVPLAKLECSSVYEAKDLIESYEGVDAFDVYGSNNWISQFISKEYEGKIEFDPALVRVFNVDIEVYSEHGFPFPEEADDPITLIQLMDSFEDDIVRVWGCGEYVNDDEKVIYEQCRDEEHLIRSFVEYWEMNCPDVMTGWNVKGFDVPYIMNRTDKVLGAESYKRFSPWKAVREVSFRTDFGKEQITHNIDGVAVLDYLDLYKKYTYAGQESYTLDHIGYVELGDKKVDYSELGTLHSLYETDYQKFVAYGIQDVRLVDRIDKKMKLIDLALTLAYMTKQNYTDTFSPVKSWEALIYNHLQNQGIYTTVKRTSPGSGGAQIAGAYVKTPKLGMRNWIMSFDLNSLYPHLIAQYNIGPDTIYTGKDAPQIDFTIDGLVNKSTDLSQLDGTGLTMAASGAFFKKDKQSVLSELMMNTYSGRKAVKKEMLAVEQQIEDQGSSPELVAKVTALNNEQMALKILANSGFGACASKYFQFYDTRVAESITLSGQLSIKWIERQLNEYMNKLMDTENKEYVIYSDTDSSILELGDMVDACYKGKVPDNNTVVDFLDKVAKEQLEPFIEKAYQELADYMQAYDNKMVMKREVIASRGFWTAKKRYALYVYDSEGVRYTKPKPKVMGLEIVKSSTPEQVRSELKRAVEIILTSDEKSVIDYIEKVHDEFMELTPSQMAFPRGANGLDKFRCSTNIYKKGTPKHVKAALIHNWLVERHELEVEPIESGNKIKFIDLKLPNPTGQQVVGWPSHLDLPKEFGLEEYVDKETAYQKTFLKPMETMLDSIGWKSEEVPTLEDFF